MNKTQMSWISGILVIIIIITGYIVLLAGTNPSKTEPDPLSKNSSKLSKELLSNQNISQLLERRSIGNLPVQPPDITTDNPFKALE